MMSMRMLEVAALLISGMNSKPTQVVRIPQGK
jgi:hypothetical protein